jgi:ADP-ribose pyrophosphatase YjhB (NUDIX family)
MLGANVAILQNNTVLLTRREDWEIWCLPGGAVDPGESVAEAALREAREETGLHIRLLTLVGLYSRPAWQTYNIALFTAEIVGGELRPQAGEVIDMQFFPLDALPEDLLAGHRQRLADVAAGCGGSMVRTEYIDYPFPPEVDRWAVYRLRDESGMDRRAFYYQHFSEGEMTVDVLKVHHGDD